MTSRSILPLLLPVLTSWMVLQLLLRFTGLPVTAVLVLMSGCMAVTIYGLRFHSRRMTPLSRHPAGRGWLKLVCRFSHQQEAPSDRPLDGLALKTAEDFDWLSDRIKADVFGHDAVVTAMVTELKKNALLRAHSESKADLPPLGVFVLAGPRGIGKRYLVTQIGQRLFHDAPVTAIDLRHCPDDSAVAHLFGAPGQDGVLVKAVRLSPFHTVILENVESAGSGLQDALQQLLQSGFCMDRARGGRVSFEKCVFALTTTAAPKGNVSDGPSSDHNRELEAFSDATGCSPGLLNTAQLCLTLTPQDDLAKAQVILQLMIEECRRYRLSLEYVEPEVVAREVSRFTETAGFEHSRMRISRWLSDPIHLAVQHGMESLVLTADLVDQSDTPRPSASPRRSHSIHSTASLEKVSS